MTQAVATRGAKTDALIVRSAVGVVTVHRLGGKTVRRCLPPLSDTGLRSTQMDLWKGVFGRKRKAQNCGNQKTKVRVGVAIRNKRTDLGRP